MSLELTHVRAIGLSDDEVLTLRRLLTLWSRKRFKNALLGVYYDGHRVLRDLGISLPPETRNIQAALGWPAKAVQYLTRKHKFEGFSLNGEVDPFDMGEVFERNNFGLELPQALNSTYKQAVSFISSTRGVDGEPDVVLQARDAEWTTALWDKRRREISAALAIVDTDENDQPCEAVFYTRDAVLNIRREWGVWKVDRQPNRTGRVLVEPFINDPQISRPFGYSRITREVRYLTDAALRTLVRTEVSAEFFASPQRYVLGAKEGAFSGDNRWSAVMSRLLALDVNEEGEKPSVGQFQQMTMSPHLEHYRQLAQNFCAATDLPQSSVGLFSETPASAEAMEASEARLSETAEYQWRVFRHPLKRLAQNVVMLRDNLSSPPPEMWKLDVKWTPCRYVSPQAAADFTVKAVAAVPKIGETTEALRGLGFTTTQIEGMQAEWRRASGASVLERVLAARGDSPAALVGSGQVSGDDVEG